MCVCLLAVVVVVAAAAVAAVAAVAADVVDINSGLLGCSVRSIDFLRTSPFIDWFRCGLKTDFA